MTNKHKEYEFKDPDFESFISCALAHSLTYTKENVKMVPKLSKVKIYSLTAGPTSKTISRKRPSISLIQNRNLDFIWPSKLLIEISQEIFWRLCSNFNIGTLALPMNVSVRHTPAKTTFWYMKTQMCLINSNFPIT